MDMKFRYKHALGCVLAVCMIVAGALLPATAYGDTDTALVAASSSTKPVSVYRLYNPNSGEHFYTKNKSESNALAAIGWRFEGVGWTAPTSGTAVYRLYNPNGGYHHFTTSKGELKLLVKSGWKNEGESWYSSTSKQVPVYRSYNPHATFCAHNFTASRGEHNLLVKQGWRDEGVGWYGAQTTATTSTPIMGASKVTQNAVVKHFKANGTYPKSVYAKKGAATIEDFVRILFEVCESEGVRPEVAYAQCMVETGLLAFGGVVDVSQCNFCGLGAGDDAGCVFPDVRTGLLAQAQHLKAYACTDALNNECVDPRFELVDRGSAPTVEGLADAGWATNDDYGESILSVMKEFM